MKSDPIIDMSPEQKLVRVGKMRAELLTLGYSIVSTAWLLSVNNAVKSGDVRTLEKA